MVAKPQQNGGAPASDGAGDVRRSLGWRDFWRTRNDENYVWLDQCTVNALSCFAAFAAHRLGVSPNQLSALSGLFAIAAFAAALLLPAADFAGPIVAIFALAQLSYLFDCADGQLARASRTATLFGAFLDKGIDIASGTLAFGAFFGFGYRHFTAQSDTGLSDAGLSDTGLSDSGLAGLCLIVGFIFIMARSSRFLAWQTYIHMFNRGEEVIQDQRTWLRQLFLSFMDHQMSLFAILLALASPLLSFVVFTGQAAVLTLVYLRYFVRAYEKDRG